MNIWLLKNDLNLYRTGVICNSNWDDILTDYVMNNLSTNKCKDLKFEFFKDGHTKISNVVKINNGLGITFVDKLTKKVIEKKYSDLIQFIPIKVKNEVEERYLMNIKAVNDAIDLEKSDCKMIGEDYVYDIKKYIFKENVLEYDIFNCYEYMMVQRTRTYCNDNYKKIIEDNNITGYKFIKIFEIEDK